MRRLRCGLSKPPLTAVELLAVLGRQGLPESADALDRFADVL